ncbi:MAG TPA: aminotransferase class III-fold pyridoxal phosphate-dependent enzyme, partial [Arenicellales bacterium]|nr:aminotransferase class III-fold pyridoxal phosphate-dependent enzyme [Arenicellales bacterium]
LDCYNNVPHVGHAHPHVVNAVARQSATLNTNTRYLYDSILEYSERLAALLPGELGVFLFVNSGSEANDLAWRIARAATGRAGAVVTANAYHGGTGEIAHLSPSGGGAVADHVRTVPAPGSGGSGEMERAITALDSAGHGLAAFMVDSTFSSDGILEPSGDWLKNVFEQTRAAGGLCIADEVQAGFGRLGEWWGFQCHGVVPDIVTLGKPMANGYPAGAVITSPTILAEFARASDYFSTFGGNPVACMAALAVLDVIEREDLVAGADEVGRYLRRRLEALAARHPGIAEVRGRGLFQGVELVKDGEPAAQQTRAVALALRDRGVLVGTEGPDGNVLKIRPPLACRQRHVDILVDTLDEVLTDRPL